MPDNQSFTTDHWIALTNPKQMVINGLRLFALKYHSLPCVMNEQSARGKTDYGDVFSMGLARQGNILSGSLRRKASHEQAVYHSTR
jgi:hypothetical protein